MNENIYLKSLKEPQNTASLVNDIKHLHNSFKIESVVPSGNKIKLNISNSNNNSHLTTNNPSDRKNSGKNNLKNLSSVIPNNSNNLNNRTDINSYKFVRRGQKLKQNYYHFNIEGNVHRKTVSIKNEEEINTRLMQTSGLNVVTNNPNNTNNINNNSLHQNNLNLISSDFNSNQNNQINNSNNPNKQNSISNLNHISNPEQKVIDFKTEYMSKFSSLIPNYGLLANKLDNEDSNFQSIFYEHLHKLKYLSEKKDKVLFEEDASIFRSKTLFKVQGIEITHDFLTDVFYHRNFSLEPLSIRWKNTVKNYYDFEKTILSLFHILFNKIYSIKNDNMQLHKALYDKDKHNKTYKDRIKELENYININDVDYKGVFKRNMENNLKEVKERFREQEKIGVMNVYKYEEEVKELTWLLAEQKKYAYKYNDTIDLLDKEKGHTDDIRKKFQEEIESLNLRIAFVNNDRNKITDETGRVDKENDKLRLENKQMNEKCIANLTTIKLLKSDLKQLEELLAMSNSEIESHLHNLGVMSRKINDNQEREMIRDYRMKMAVE